MTAEDLRFLDEIWKHLDGIADGAQDASYAEQAALRFSEPLANLIRRERERGFHEKAEHTLNKQMLIAARQLTKARGFAAHTEEAGEVCREDCEGCNDPVGQIIRDVRALRIVTRGAVQFPKG